MEHVALLRGINVGTAKRLAMADLRGVAARVGFGDPATVLNSGNLVFSADEPLDAAATAALRAAIAADTGVDADLVVVTADDLRSIADANPLRRDGRPAKLLSVAFAQDALDPASDRPDAETLAPEELVVAPRAVYQWLPDGVLASRVPAAWWRSLDSTVTARNDATVQKIVALLDARRNP
ncbi:DUF1697 domain-containing protein [Frigoribacterium sp. 2-23]|uniref:DUF1697 domain-containing protein n=1 Tax=Frigoribacterium sp. 2-23 TaxID=3415006 RepID=UPI003C6EF84C